VQLDFEANEGIAEGAVLRFLGVPILALPVLSFPLNDERKSGWLPPTINIDNRSGLELAVPYYWNIAPNRDATLTPRHHAPRASALDSEFRYLEPAHNGDVQWHCCPTTASPAARARPVGQRARWAAAGGRPLAPEGCACPTTPGGRTSRRPCAQPDAAPAAAGGWNCRARPVRAGAAFAWSTRRVQYWQVLQGTDPCRHRAPYQRAPQLGLQLARAVALAGPTWHLQTEVNRFELPPRHGSPTEPTGWRWHALGQHEPPGARRAPGSRQGCPSTWPATALDRPMADGRAARVARDPQFQRRRRAALRARHHAVRPRAAPDAGAAHAVRQHAVP
jgi:LPS-assembly protein